MSAGKARVVITGLGALTPIGSDVGTYWQNLLAGRSGVAPITLFPTEGMPVTIGAEIKGFQPTDHIDPKDAQRQDRFCQFAVATGKMALDDSGLNLDKVNSKASSISINDLGADSLDTVELVMEIIGYHTSESASGDQGCVGRCRCARSKREGRDQGCVGEMSYLPDSLAHMR